MLSPGVLHALHRATLVDEFSTVITGTSQTTIPAMPGIRFGADLSFTALVTASGAIFARRVLDTLCPGWPRLHTFSKPGR